MTYNYFTAPMKNPFETIADHRKAVADTKERLAGLDVENVNDSSQISFLEEKLHYLEMLFIEYI